MSAILSSKNVCEYFHPDSKMNESNNVGAKLTCLFLLSSALYQRQKLAVIVVPQKHFPADRL